MSARDSDPLLHFASYHSTHPAGQEHVFKRRLRKSREFCQNALASRKKHFIIMSLVALDVTCLLANIFLQLIACEMHQKDEPWVLKLSWALEAVGLLISSLFMVELVMCLFAFGFSYLKSAFHVFDAVIIVLSFVIDVVSSGLTEEIGSLIVILRLWRLAKISEELMIGAEERVDMLEAQLEAMSAENSRLKRRLGAGSYDD